VTERSYRVGVIPGDGTGPEVVSEGLKVLDAVRDGFATPDEWMRAFSEINHFEEQLVEATELIRKRVVAVWQVVSQLRGKVRERASRPLSESGGLTAIFERERHRLRVEPAAAARLLRALTLSLTHPLLSAEPAPADEIVSVVLHGIERVR